MTCFIPIELVAYIALIIFLIYACIQIKTNSEFGAPKSSSILWKEDTITISNIHRVLYPSYVAFISFLIDTIVSQPFSTLQRKFHVTIIRLAQSGFGNYWNLMSYSLDHYSKLSLGIAFAITYINLLLLSLYNLFLSFSNQNTF